MSHYAEQRECYTNENIKTQKGLLVRIETMIQEINRLIQERQMLQIFLESKAFKALPEKVQQRWVIKEYCMYQYIDILELLLADEE